MAKLSWLLFIGLSISLIGETVLGETSTDKVHKKVCIRDTDVNPALVEKALEGDFSENRELKCFFRCYHLESGFMNDKGEVQTDKIKAKIPATVDKRATGRAIDSCKGVKGLDSCETAYKLQKCLHENKVELV